jgi:hypothetical protein
MFEVCRDHEVRVTPQELSGDLHFRTTTQQIFGNLVRSEALKWHSKSSVMHATAGLAVPS